jgi:hypothetical protein
VTREIFDDATSAARANDKMHSSYLRCKNRHGAKAIAYKAQHCSGIYANTYRLEVSQT